MWNSVSATFVIGKPCNTVLLCELYLYVVACDALSSRSSINLLLSIDWIHSIRRASKVYWISDLIMDVCFYVIATREKFRPVLKIKSLSSPFNSVGCLWAHKITFNGALHCSSLALFQVVKCINFRVYL